jgi:hypothetical protein
MVTGSDRRGQLILVGAILIALVVVGITIIVNTVLFVENTSTDQSTTELRQAEQVEAELRDAIRSTTFRVNHRNRNHSASELRRATERNVTRLTRTMDQQYLASQSLSVTVSVNGTDNGTRLVQTADGDFTHPNPPPSMVSTNWHPVKPGAPPSPRLGWFVLNLNATEPTTGPFDVEVRNESGSAVSVEVERLNGSAYEIRSDVYTGGDTTVTCGTRGNRLVLNMRDGTSPTDESCTFNGTAEIANASTVEFSNADQAYGKYAVVIDETYASGPSLPASVQSCDSPTNPPPTDPCYTPVVWALQFETEIASESVSRTGEHNVTVYPGGGGS